MKLNFRKIASVLASTVMISSTAALAVAANYPAPFVQNGMADVAVVWGTTAANTDLVAVTDITASLEAELGKQAPTTPTTNTTITGARDVVKLEKSSDKFNLGDTMSGVFGATVDDEDLEVLLADGTYLNDENTEYEYEQKLTLLARSLTYFADSDYKDKEPTVGFQVSSGVPVLNYTLDFTTDAESDITSGDLVDFETTNLNILGKNYYILDFKNDSTSANTYSGKVTLLDAATSAIVTEGETQTVTVNGKSYEVAINFVTSSNVKLEVNGQVTNSLANGETFKLTDGTYIGIKEILHNAKDTGISKTEFSIGSGKLEITSDGSEIELNDDAVDGMKGWFVKGTKSGTKERLDKFVLQWDTDEEEFIAPSADLVQPGFQAIKFSMTEFVVPSPETINVDHDGDDSIELKIPIKDGSAKFNLLKANSTGGIDLIGKDTDQRLATTNESVLYYYQTVSSNNYHRWFVASYNTSDNSESYLLSASVTESEGKNRTTIKNEVTGENVCTDKVADDVCDIGDVSFTITQVNRTSSDKNVKITAAAASNTKFDRIYSKEGLLVFLPVAVNGTTSSTAPGHINLNISSTSAGYNRDSYYVFMEEEDKDDDVAEGVRFNVTVNNDADGDLHISAVDTGQTNKDIPGSDDDTTSRVVSALATKVDRIVAADRGQALITYSGKEAYAQVYLTDTGATASSGGTSQLGSVSVKDSEVASVSGKNLIVVGGSCVNTVAAELLGVTAPACGEAFTAATGVGDGQFLIQSFSSKWATGKIATLVAGYNAADTTNAAKYLTTQTVDTSAGQKMVKTSAEVATLV